MNFKVFDTSKIDECAQGQAENIRIQTEKILNLRAQLNKILSEKTDLPLPPSEPQKA